MSKISQEIIKELLTYNPVTGIFTWNVNRSRARKGKEAGTRDRSGYIGISIDRVIYRAHRLAFIYMNGEEPDIVDHINGITNDNRWVNLRSVTCGQNNLNRKLSSHNTSGCKGVSWRKRDKRWRVKCRADGVEYWLGTYVELSEAEAVIKAFREKLHGDFCNHGNGIEGGSV